MQAVEQVVDVVRVVLPVAIDLHRYLVAMLEGVDIAALHGAPDTQVEGHPKHRGTSAPRALGGGVDRAVVDDEHVEIRRLSSDRLDGRGDRLGLVVGGNDGEMASHDGSVCSGGGR